MIIYAHDIMLMVRGPTHPIFLQTFQDCLQIIDDGCKTQELQISKEKSALMPMFARKKETYLSHPTVTEWGLNEVTKMKYLGIILDSKLDWYPHTLLLENKILYIRKNLVRCSKAPWGMQFHHLMTIYHHSILVAIMYTAEAWFSLTSRRARHKLLQIQQTFLIFSTKAYKTVSSFSLQAIAGIMRIDQAIILTTTSGPYHQTHDYPYPKHNHIVIDSTRSLGKADLQIFNDGSKTDHHVGSGMMVMKNSKEIHSEIRRLCLDCSVFQAEIIGYANISYAIHTDSKAALLGIANKRTTHPLAVDARNKIINFKSSTFISLHWVKGHQGNERAEHLTKIDASHRITIDYKGIPLTQCKQLLTKPLQKNLNSTYINSEQGLHTKTFIPNISHRLSLSLGPSYITTQFLINHGSFRSYLYKMNKCTSPLCNCTQKPPHTALHLIKDAHNSQDLDLKHYGLLLCIWCSNSTSTPLRSLPSSSTSSALCKNNLIITLYYTVNPQ
ncbi:hypothetical protein ANN_28034 [Periplaneta americana]|uniref:RNase H type-1 domain-containing protein n=1 Tax=Periplaneta americana TaxID=6978 RepID=A0ABQ8RUS3_PERAM|nr:hypothetical protein ANN_28034 [Periplaneta americana]